MIKTWYDEASLHLDAEDQQKQTEELEPEAKRKAFVFFAMVLHMAHPPPSAGSYYHFGFCVCRHEMAGAPPAPLKNFGGHSKRENSLSSRIAMDCALSVKNSDIWILS